MRHRLHYFKKLGRKPSHRKAMIRNLITALLKHERIETTLGRAKEMRKWLDKMITYSKKGTKEAKAKIRGFVNENIPIIKLHGVYRDRYMHRPGGYSRVVRSRFRRGDGAPMAYIELVDRNGEFRPSRPCRPNQQHNQIIAKRNQQKSEWSSFQRDYHNWLAKCWALSAPTSSPLTTSAINGLTSVASYGLPPPFPYPFPSLAPSTISSPSSSVMRPSPLFTHNYVPLKPTTVTSFFASFKLSDGSSKPIKPALTSAPSSASASK